MEFNKRISELYPELFTISGEGDGERNIFSSKWGSYQELYTLSQGDLTRYEAISEMTLHNCLMYLAYETDKTQELNKRIKKQNK